MTAAATLARGHFFAKISKPVDFIFNELAISLFFEKTSSSLYDMSVLAKKAHIGIDWCLGEPGKQSPRNLARGGRSRWKSRV